MTYIVAQYVRGGVARRPDADAPAPPDGRGAGARGGARRRGGAGPRPRARRRPPRRQARQRAARRRRRRAADGLRRRAHARGPAPHGAEHAHVGTVPYMPPEQARGAPARSAQRPLLARRDAVRAAVRRAAVRRPATRLAILAQHAGAAAPERGGAQPGDRAAARRARRAADGGRRGRAPAVGRGAVLERLDALAPGRPRPVPPPARRPLVEAVRLPPALAGGRPGRRSSAAPSRSAQLRETWRARVAGEPGVVLVRGERRDRQDAAVHAASPARRTRDGGTVLYGRCEEDVARALRPVRRGAAPLRRAPARAAGGAAAARRASSWRGSAGPCRAPRCRRPRRRARTARPGATSCSRRR